MNNQTAIRMAKNLKADQQYTVYRRYSVAQLALIIKKASKSSLVIDDYNKKNK